MCRYASASHALGQTGQMVGRLRAFLEGFNRLGVYTGLTVLYIVGGEAVKRGSMEIGTLVSFVGYTFVMSFASQGLLNRSCAQSAMLVCLFVCFAMNSAWAAFLTLYVFMSMYVTFPFRQRR